MTKIVEKWLLYKYIGLEFHSAVETLQDKGTGGKGAGKVRGARTQNDWGRCDPNQEMMILTSESFCARSFIPPCAGRVKCRHHEN